jgi:hypothetical protein
MGPAQSPLGSPTLKRTCHTVYKWLSGLRELKDTATLTPYSQSLLHLRFRSVAICNLLLDTCLLDFVLSCITSGLPGAACSPTSSPLQHPIGLRPHSSGPAIAIVRITQLSRSSALSRRNPQSPVSIPLALSLFLSNRSSSQARSASRKWAKPVLSRTQQRLHGDARSHTAITPRC